MKKSMVKISDIKKNFNDWSEFAMKISNHLSALVDYTKEKPSLLSVLLALRLSGYEIKYEM